MPDWRVIYTKTAVKDLETACSAGFKDKVVSLINLLREDHFARYPAFEKLVGDLSGLYSRRVNHKHRLVYMIDVEAKVVKVISAWTHYE